MNQPPERHAYYHQTRAELLPFVPRGARRVLDCGCAGGAFGAQIRRRNGAEVIGIECVEGAWRHACDVLDRAILADLDTAELPFPDSYFDCICCADVLEHLREPGSLLQRLYRVLAPHGLMVLSIPNVRFYRTLLMLAEGRWTYEDSGIMDRTHLRFFTLNDMRELVETAGGRVLASASLSAVPEEHLPRRDNGSLHIGRLELTEVDDADYLDLRTMQYVVLAVRPDFPTASP